ncbi:LigA protein [Kutzneria sp. 744]|nr:LigA protein [Kutzneria sp. 744]
MITAKVVALRERIFARVNGEEGIPVPSERFDAAAFRELYASPAAHGRSEGAGLSDLFWYWLAPGPQVHQEHLEAGPRYDQAARTSRHVLAVPKPQIEELSRRCAARVLDELPRKEMTEVRLRDLMMPIWAEVYYELVFQESCPRHARNLIVANADDVVTSLKATGLRHMRTRDRLTDYLRRRIDDVPVELPELFTRDEKAWYLQGAFFNTAVVQMSEAMTHLLLAVAQHEKVQDRLVREPADDDYLDRVINEALRAFPLFGIAHRITTEDIRVSGTTVHSGSVLLFNYAAYQNSGFERPEQFDPDRWEHLSPKDTTFIPFGVTANRACPARGVAPVSMRAVAREVLRRFALASSVSHTRSIPHRGPCLLVDRKTETSLREPLARMRRRDRREDITRSLTQLVLGTYMVWDARRRRMCGNYFEGGA